MGLMFHRINGRVSFSHCLEAMANSYERMLLHPLECLSVQDYQYGCYLIINTDTAAWYYGTAKPRFLTYSRSTISYIRLNPLQILSESSSHSRGQWVWRLLFRV